MGAERRQDKLRVRFSQPVSVWIMGIDGTWRRSCSMEDISDTGATLTVEGALDGLHLKEFFLLLPSTGLVYRQLVCRNRFSDPAFAPCRRRVPHSGTGPGAGPPALGPRREARFLFAGALARPSAVDGAPASGSEPDSAGPVSCSPLLPNAN
jgi:hypothetical protein